MKRFEKILKEGDLRTVGKVKEVIAEIKDQQAFDQLFKGLYSDDRKVIMRTADAIEKITSIVGLLTCFITNPILFPFPSVPAFHKHFQPPAF
jgi:hypothetical protein